MLYLSDSSVSLVAGSRFIVLNDCSDLQGHVLFIIQDSCESSEFVDFYDETAKDYGLVTKEEFRSLV